MRAACAGVLLATLVPILASGATAAPAYKHLGVATCATGVCHGKSAPQVNKHVNLNEYNMWKEGEDRHALAFRALDSPKSKAIAAKLGLASAIAAKICLDCHTDNVPATQRGSKFQVTDGIGCEACHGGAEKWVETHAAPSTKHADNVAKGMYPSEQPLARAKLCVSCHLGDGSKFVTHVIIGAGHPRLWFELNAFGTKQAHYDVDDDYRDRKGSIEGINLWVTGQLEGARRNLELLQGDRFHPPGMIPELAFYECQSCHHSTKDLRWTPKRAGPGIRPGTLRLQKPHLVMLRAVTEAIGSPAGLKQLNDGTVALIRAGQSDPAAVKAAAGTLLAWIKSVEPWSKRAFSRTEVVKIRKTLVNYAANDLASDYAAAEQIVVGAESLSYSLDDRDRVQAALDKLFTALGNDATFNPAHFAEIARSVQPRF